MSHKLSQYLGHQQAPDILFRYPRLLYIYFWLNRHSVLRMKYARRAIHRALHLYSNGYAPRRVLDAGCGMGDFLFTIPEFVRSESLFGIDLSPSNIAVCTAFRDWKKMTNTHLRCGDLSVLKIPEHLDIIICIAVLHYIQDDQKVLHAFRHALQPDGKLLLYVPVNYRRSLSLYRRVAKRPDFDYDDIFGRKNTYTDGSIREKLQDCGFRIVEQKHSFGRTAAVMFEISSLFEWLFKSIHPLVAIPVIPFYLFFYPLYLVSLYLDYTTTRQTGNGVMIIAEPVR